MRDTVVREGLVFEARGFLWPPKKKYRGEFQFAYILVASRYIVVRFPPGEIQRDLANKDNVQQESTSNVPILTLTRL